MKHISRWVKDRVWTRAANSVGDLLGASTAAVKATVSLALFIKCGTRLSHAVRQPGSACARLVHSEMESKQEAMWKDSKAGG